MTEKEIKAYNEQGEKRVKNGKTLKLFRSRNVTGRQLEYALREDAKQWQGDFFKQFMGTPELQEYYNKSKENRDFLNSIFRSAFMYGGCYLLRAWEEFGKDPVQLSEKELAELKAEMEKVAQA